MKSIVVAAAVAAFGGAMLGSAGARADDIWHLYNSDEPTAFLAVVESDTVDEPENHYPFSMACSAYGEWLMVVSDVDARALGESIASGGLPAFSFVLDGVGGEGDGDYYPSINFGEMEGVWEYSIIWGFGLLDQLASANDIKLTGVGVDMTLPSEGKAEAFEAFKAACDGIESADTADEPIEDDGADPGN